MDRKRLATIARWIVLPAFALLAARYGWIQIVKSNYYQQKAVEQRVKEIPQDPERGKITDRNGNVLAMSLVAEDIAVYPNLITDPDQQKAVSKALSDTLGLNYNDVYAKVTAKDSKGNLLAWNSIAKKVDPDKAAKIKNMKLGGIEISQSPKRIYPNNTLGSSILGFVNSQGDPGGVGVEVSMNQYLSGVEGYKVAETDNVGKVIPIGLENISTPQDGDDVQLTVDSYMQYVLENALQQRMQEEKAKSIHGIIMNPKTGEVLAMASFPSFNPSDYLSSTEEQWNNNPVHFTYEPGSILKPIIMSIALDDGTISPNTTYNDPGWVAIPGASNVIIHDSESRNLGTVNLETIIAKSLNVGMVHVGSTLTPQQMVDGLKQAGFGAPTGIELPGEEMGIFHSADFLDKDPVSKATISYGQGISVTPIQEITAFSEIVNGGHKITPHIVESVKDKSGNVLYTPKDPGNVQVFKPDVTALMRSYLLDDWKSGTVSPAAVPGYDGGGKTGTATDAITGKIKVGSLIGFVPYDDPQYVCLISTEDPQVGKYGADVSGPAFKEVMSEILRYKSVPMKTQSQQQEIDVPDVRWTTFQDAQATLQSKIANAIVDKQGDGNVVVDQSYNYQDGKFHVVLQTSPISNKGDVNIPSLFGKSKEEVQSIFNGSGVNLDFHGDGNVTEQSLMPGKYVNQNTLSIWLN